MRALLLLGLALIAGCDDDSLPAQVANAQLHGIVKAQIDCQSALMTRTTSPFDTTTLSYKAQRLIDGSCLMSSNVALLTLIPRSDANAATCAGGSGASMFAENGALVYQSTPSSLDRFEGAIDEVCTGFNLEAFGVE